jgi:hypothetical protein
VYARVGEQRVIPIVVENERRREKDITLELSKWTTRGGKPAPVETRLLDPREFTLAPCAEQKITLVVDVRELQPADQSSQPESPNQPKGRGRAAAAAAGATEVIEIPRGIKLPDVDDCVVAIADLRLEGCDHRPLRIAVAVLPRDCDPYTVSCGCSCC